MPDEQTFSVLYIEDNEANRMLVEYILERRGNIKLSSTASGGAGIEKAREILPDLILLDISLPDMNGFAVLNALREDRTTQKIPVVAVSGDWPLHPPEDTPFVFDRCLTKPIEVLSLYRTIDELIPSQAPR